MGILYTHGAGNLGILLCNMGDEAAAAPLLCEAVQGLTAVYSEGYMYHLATSYSTTKESWTT